MDSAIVVAFAAGIVTQVPGPCRHPHSDRYDMPGELELRAVR
jgi:hypothetical protein